MVGRVAALVGQGAVIGIKGHIAEAKKLVSCQFVSNQFVSKQTLCVGLVVVVVEDTISRIIFQTVFERSQSSRERNGFQIGATYKGITFNGFYFFRDDDLAQVGAIKKTPSMTPTK